MPPGIRPRKQSSGEFDGMELMDEKKSRTGLYICATALVVLIAAAIYFW